MAFVIRNVRLRGDHRLLDIAIENDRIAEIAPHIKADGSQDLDGEGSLVLPGFVNAHLHLDKCMLGDIMRPNESQTLQEAIHITWDHKRTSTPGEIADRADSVIQAAIVNGTTAIRGFADVDTIGGLNPVLGLLELRRRWKDSLRVEVVAFPQEGILRDPGCAELMEEAARIGADVIGGLPWYELTEPEVHEHVDFCFELAQRFGKDIHMLADDTDDPTSRSLEYLAVRTIREGYQRRVTASHCGALAAYDHSHAKRVIALVAEAEISIATNTHISLVLDGRNDRGLVRRGITRVNELIEAGVNVLSAQDDVNDPYYPFGKPDQLEVAQYTAHVAQLTDPSELETVVDMVTANPAKAMRMEGYGIKEGNQADLVVVGAPTVHAALRQLPPRRAVFYRGKLMAESTLKVTHHWDVQPSGPSTAP